MVSTNEFSVVDLVEDGYSEYDSSGEESKSICSGESKSMESIDHNVCDNYIENSESDEIDERFFNVKTMTMEEIANLDFNSQEAAYKFYRKYGRAIGFAVRKDIVRRNVKKEIVFRRFVCNRNGSRDPKHLTRVDRKRDPRAVTRIECEARLCVKYDAENLTWLVTDFVHLHNHELTPSKLVHLYPIYRGMTDADKAQVDSMQSYGIRTCHIMGYMVANKGGYGAVGFTKKDLYNYLSKKMLFNIKDGDVLASLSYLGGKAGLDPMLFSKYATNVVDDKLKSMFWADGQSRSDYLCFGDVVAFDTTYKKNKYNYPLVIFSGCNNHSKTTIFGAALVSDETIETYKWVLSSFLEAMGNRQPKAVVTGGDLAMREAIKSILPESCHRLCAWHLHKNASENVKNKEFLKDFAKAMYSSFTPDEFEDFWSNIVERHELQRNRWVSKTYENKKLWATAYFRDKFFGRIRTTSQCESINSLVKKYVKKKCSIYDFMHSYDQAVMEYRNNEENSDFMCITSEPVLTTGLHSIEKDAAKIYTLDMFIEVQQEIVKSSALIVSEREEIDEKLMFKLTKTCDTKYNTEVVYETSTSSFHCECRLFESRGIPCSHIIFVLKEEHVDHIPKSLILDRWTKNAKMAIMQTDLGKGLDSNLAELCRQGAYTAACNKLCKVAAESGACFNEVMDDILKVIEKYSNLKTGGNVPTQNSEMNQHVRDPDVIKTKGIYVLMISF